MDYSSHLYTDYEEEVSVDHEGRSRNLILVFAGAALFWAGVVVAVLYLSGAL